jgi:pimeloyl-ACP methyl ester carboxylesterase
MPKMSIRGVSMNIKVTGRGEPLVLMHGGPGADLYTMMSFKPLANNFTLVLYDHRCNGRSKCADITSMTMENLAADADALRQALGFDKWSVLGHSFGGYVALEYALRYPQSLTHLLLVDTGGDYRWGRENAPKVLAQRGFTPDIVELASHFLNGQIEPQEMQSDLMKLGKAYNPYTGLHQLPHMLLVGLKTKLQPRALIFAANNYLKNWNVMDRLGEIKVPTLVLAGIEDFIYPPEHQQELARRISSSRMVLIDRAGHNPQDEQTARTLQAIRDFMAEARPVSDG